LARVPPPTAPPVYPPREDTRLLARAAGSLRRGTRALEIGCGAGAAALAAASAGAHVVATDRNPFALRALARAARHRGLRVDLVRTDLAHGLGRFEAVLANPPYLPTPPELRDPDPWVNLALDGGPDGLSVVRRILRELPRHLEPGGAAFVVFSSLQPERARGALFAAWRRRGGSLSTVDRVDLEGERLELVRLEPGPASPRARDGRGARRRSAPRPPARSGGSPSASSRGRAMDRRPARGAA
jgi:release factor glutamine methyltransferase